MTMVSWMNLHKTPLLDILFHCSKVHDPPFPLLVIFLPDYCLVLQLSNFFHHLPSFSRRVVGWVIEFHSKHFIMWVQRHEKLLEITLASLDLCSCNGCCLQICVDPDCSAGRNSKVMLEAEDICLPFATLDSPSCVPPCYYTNFHHLRWSNEVVDRGFVVFIRHRVGRLKTKWKRIWLTREGKLKSDDKQDSKDDNGNRKATSSNQTRQIQIKRRQRKSKDDNGNQNTTNTNQNTTNPNQKTTNRFRGSARFPRILNAPVRTPARSPEFHHQINGRWQDSVEGSCSIRVFRVFLMTWKGNIVI